MFGVSWKHALVTVAIVVVVLYVVRKNVAGVPSKLGLA